MKTQARNRRHKRITKKLQGTDLRPRLVVFRSKKHIYAQLVNDLNQKVITGVSTLSKEFKAKNLKSSNKEAGQAVGKLLAEKCQGLGVKEVCFDRAGYTYHGRVKSLSQGAREGGLKL